MNRLGFLVTLSFIAGLAGILMSAGAKKNIYIYTAAYNQSEFFRAMPSLAVSGETINLPAFSGNIALKQAGVKQAYVITENFEDKGAMKKTSVHIGGLQFDSVIDSRERR